MNASQSLKPVWHGEGLGKRLLLGLNVVALAAGGLFTLAGRPDLGSWSWAGGTAVVLAALLTEIAISLGKREFGLDLIAALAMSGALTLDENLAGSIIALMFTGRQALEAFAQRRASVELMALLGRVRRTAARYADGQLEEIPVEQIVTGNRILVRNGEVLPVDGSISGGVAVLDESALTGGALPVRRRAGEAVMSGTTNAGYPFELVASNTADDSTYAGIARLVEAARAAKAPMTRLADRYALLFLAVTLLLSAAAWGLSGDPIRALAVLVVATPCPLILAVPVDHFGCLAMRQKGHHRKRRWCPRDTRRRQDGDPRQDRNNHRWPSPSSRGQGMQRPRPAGGPASGGVPGSGVAPRYRSGTGCGRS
ncbi:cation transport ATPase [Sinorhizobium fredii]